MKNLNTKLIPFILVAVIAVIAGGRFAYSKISGKQGIDMRKFLTVTMSGYDTYGKASISVNKEALADAVKEYSGAAPRHEYTFKLSKDKDLSNDDEIWVQVYEDGKEMTSGSVKEQVQTQSKEEKEKAEEAESAYVDLGDTQDAGAVTTAPVYSSGTSSTSEPGSAAEAPEAQVASSSSKSRSVAFKDMKIKVAGLKEVTKYTAADTFKTLIYTLTGASPWMSISFENKSEDENIKNYVSFTCNKQDHIACGETLEFTNHVDEKSCERLGIRIEEGKCKVTVSNQYNTYIESPSDLSQNDLQTLIKKASDIVSSVGGATMNLPDGSTETVSRVYDAKLAGIRFLKMKESASAFSDSYNGLYFTFSFTAVTRSKTDGKEEAPKKEYVCVKIANIIKLPQGTLDEDDLDVNADTLMDKSLKGYVDTMYTSETDALNAATKGLDDTYDISAVDLNSLAKTAESRTITAEADSMSEAA